MCSFSTARHRSSSTVTRPRSPPCLSVARYVFVLLVVALLCSGQLLTSTLHVQNIQERITKLDFQDCKVRVSNVDTQACGAHILIQVIGEISNKGEESRKFVQTFVLAEQPSGYFVLNDIFRYINEADDEPVEAAAAAAAADEHKDTPAPEEAKKEEVHDAVKPEENVAELDPAAVDKKLEEDSTTGPKESPVLSAVATPVEHVSAKTAEPAPVAVTPVPVPTVVMPALVPSAEKAAQEVADEEETKAEKPKEPSPTPAAVRTPAAAAPAAAPIAAEPEKPKGPPKPMTWASRAAAAAGPARSVALPKPAAPATSPATAPAAVARPAAAAAAPTAPAAAASKPATTDSNAAAAAASSVAGKDSNNEWQTAGADSKRQNRPQPPSGAIQDKDITLGYVKYVTDKVEEDALRSHLETFGAVVYFDINRAKNCAFIEFASPAGYQAAVAANPHTINGENIMVEARRPKAGAYGGSNYSSNRGGIAGRGRGGYENRNGNQGGARGGFSGQGRYRGGAGAPRGRGGAQTSAA